jgi:hypothetical protein
MTDHVSRPQLQSSFRDTGNRPRRTGADRHGRRDPRQVRQPRHNSRACSAMVAGSATACSDGTFADQFVRQRALHPAGTLATRMRTSSLIADTFALAARLGPRRSSSASSSPPTRSDHPCCCPRTRLRSVLAPQAAARGIAVKLGFEYEFLRVRRNAAQCAREGLQRPEAAERPATSVSTPCCVRRPNPILFTKGSWNYASALDLSARGAALRDRSRCVGRCARGSPTALAASDRARICSRRSHKVFFEKLRPDGHVQ